MVLFISIRAAIGEARLWHNNSFIGIRRGIRQRDGGKTAVHSSGDCSMALK